MEGIVISWNAVFNVLVILVGLYAIWMKHSFSKEIEEVKNKFQKGVLVHKVQFEKEFNAYIEIWKNLIEIRRATLSLRPFGEFVDPKESPEERRERKIKSFNEQYSKFINAVEYNQPFYPPNIYEKLDSLVRLALQEGMGFTHNDLNRRDYYKEAERNRDEILRLINECCEEIRSRIRLIEEL